MFISIKLTYKYTGNTLRLCLAEADTTIKTSHPSQFQLKSFNQGWPNVTAETNKNKYKNIPEHYHNITANSTKTKSPRIKGSCE